MEIMDYLKIIHFHLQSKALKCPGMCCHGRTIPATPLPVAAVPQPNHQAKALWIGWSAKPQDLCAQRYSHHRELGLRFPVSS